MQDANSLARWVIFILLNAVDCVMPSSATKYLENKKGMFRSQPFEIIKRTYAYTYIKYTRKK